VLLPRHYPHPRFGACNAVTLFRAGLGATLVTLILVDGLAENAMKGWAVAIVATAALSLDGVDGWLARRSGLSSAFGARFDMEVDAALALLLSLLALADDAVGPVVLVLGLMRYAFVAASWRLPWMAAPLPERFGRKAVCVIQIAALIALQTPIVTGSVALTIALGAALALIWSFGRDILWLWRNRT
jgi:phosphatidylglycerophosphate synthase